MKIKITLKRVGESLINIAFWGCMAFLVFLCLQLFLITSFKIPSNSMEPTLTEGDYIVVNKTVPGPRIFNLFASIRGEETPVWRLPGIKQLEVNDVMVFHFPYPHTDDSIRMDIMKYYVKRCLGLPGDSLYIRNGYYGRVGQPQEIGFLPNQASLNRRSVETLKEKNIYHSFPHDSILGWNIRNFGPFYIPAKGDYISMTPFHVQLYGKLIEWEQKASLELNPDGKVTLAGKPLLYYQFRHNYYFSGGDHVMNSLDSRYWGLFPEEFIVGKAWFIWKSPDPLTGQMRWNRFLKKIE